MSDNIFERLKQFITDQGFGYTLPFPLLFKKKELTRNMTLESDLRITGDDADEFLIAFGKEFNVDVSQFPIGNFFNGEGDKLLSSTIRAITGKKEVQRKIITIAHLEKAIIAGRLDEEVINS
ncbi:MAG: DUF1493 family protein [Eubacterium aggregans]